MNEEQINVADKIAHQIANELAVIHDERVRAKVLARLLTELTSMMVRMLE